MKFRLAASAPTTAMLLLLAGCGGNAEPPVDEAETSPRTDAEESTDDYAIPAMDFANKVLGARIEGPVGPEVDASIMLSNSTPEDGKRIALGDIKGWVACPEGATSCNPKSLSGDAVYTYVYVVTPGVDEPNDDKFPDSTSVETVASATEFRMVLPAIGFTGTAGYSLNQARAALGTQGTFSISCDEGKLVWKVASGGKWETDEPITFFWQSSKPPAGPMDAFILEADGKQGVGAGPHPATREEATDTGCT